jgi:hypothetical protein
MDIVAAILKGFQFDADLVELIGEETQLLGSTGGRVLYVNVLTDLPIQLQELLHQDHEDELIHVVEDDIQYGVAYLTITDVLIVGELTQHHPVL